MRHRWQTKHEPPSHTDDWLMTYADMITLLLCFFAIFLAVSIPQREAAQRIEIAQAAPVPARPTQALQADVLTEVAEPSAQPKASSAKADTYSFATTDSAARLTVEHRLIPPPELVNNLPPRPHSGIDAKGDRITTYELSGAAFFDSGSATLSKDGESILRRVSVDLKSEEFKDYQITVEGHTDDTPINTPRFPSNWELSTARASAVVHFFLDQGIPAQKLRAAGYADTFPKAPNRDSGGRAIPENQTQNRRVVIKLEKIEKTGGMSVAAAESGISNSSSP